MAILPTVQKIRVCIFILLVLSTLHPSSALPIFVTTPVKCKLADFKTVVFFFLANYVSHAFSVPSVPGGAWRWSLFMQLGCIFYPFAGLTRSVVLLFNHWMQGDRGSIGDAIAQGAVMVAVRSSDWRPAEQKSERVFIGLPEDFEPPEDTGSLDELPTTKVKIKFIKFRTTHTLPFHLRMPLLTTKAKLDTRALNIHGESELPDGYHWKIPSAKELNALTALLEKPKEIQVARSQSWLKGIVALAQLVFSSITIYQARGNQLVRYGYAAFGLSVFPYTLMSLVNLIVTAVIGEYSHLSILRTAILEEAKKRPGSRISGEVGRLAAITEPTKESSGETTSAVGRLTAVTEPTKEDKGEEVSVEAADEGRINVAGVFAQILRPDEEGSASSSEERKRRQALISGEQLFTAAMLQAETKGEDTVLHVEANGRMSRFLLIHDGKEEENALTLYVSASTNTPRMDVRDGDASEIPPGVTRKIVVGSTVVMLLGVLPHIFIFLLTRYQKGHSTNAERAWMMSWLVLNQGYASLGIDFSEIRSVITIPWKRVSVAYLLIWIYATPAIGGFVMVGKMLLEFKPCAISE